MAEMPYETKTVVAYPTKAALFDITDPYFRGFNTKVPDFFRFKEFEREFSKYEKTGVLPGLILLRFPGDHFGTFKAAIRGVNTVETQMADNDYALGMLVQKVSRSRYRNDTQIFVVEDDAQNGPDHVDAHRTIAYVRRVSSRARRLVLLCGRPRDLADDATAFASRRRRQKTGRSFGADAPVCRAAARRRILGRKNGRPRFLGRGQARHAALQPRAVGGIEGRRRSLSRGTRRQKPPPAPDQAQAICVESSLRKARGPTQVRIAGRILVCGSVAPTIAVMTLDQRI
jgi:hypothetical protein